jgi:hypothetical protein
MPGSMRRARRRRKEGVISQRRPCLVRNCARAQGPIRRAVDVVGGVNGLLNHCATASDDRGYGSLRSQGRRKRVQVCKQHDFAIPRRDAPEVYPEVSRLDNRGRGECRMRAASAVSCAKWKRKRTRAYRFSGGNPTFPAQWFYGLYRALPGDRACLTPSPANMAVRARSG